MMTPGRQVALVAFLVLIAAVLQGRAAHGMQVRGAQPDLVLVVVACGATLVGGARGTWLGFWGGLLTAALNSPFTPGSYLTSRTIAGAFAGWLQGSVIRDSLVVPPLVTLATTLVTEFVYAAMAPGFAAYQTRTWIGRVVGETVYNAALALPVYFALRWMHIGRFREDPFASYME